MKRPKGVSAIASIVLLLGVLVFLGALFVGILYTFFVGEPEGGSLSILVGSIGIGSIVAAIPILLASGLFKMQKWARRWVLVFAILAFFSTAVDLASSQGLLSYPEYLLGVSF